MWFSAFLFLLPLWLHRSPASSFSFCFCLSFCSCFCLFFLFYLLSGSSVFFVAPRWKKHYLALPSVDSLAWKQTERWFSVFPTLTCISSSYSSSCFFQFDEPVGWNEMWDLYPNYVNVKWPLSYFIFFFLHYMCFYFNSLLVARAVSAPFDFLHILCYLLLFSHVNSQTFIIPR